MYYWLVYEEDGEAKDMDPADITTMATSEQIVEAFNASSITVEIFTGMSSNNHGKKIVQLKTISGLVPFIPSMYALARLLESINEALV